MPREGGWWGEFYAKAGTDPSSQEINQGAGVAGPTPVKLPIFSFVLFDLDHGIKHTSVVTLSCP